MAETCYMCSGKATGKEHAPPRCVFPEKKDSSPGVDYRRNLIRVPSCDAHNTAKSQDDEYLAFVLATHFANNAVLMANMVFYEGVHLGVLSHPNLKPNRLAGTDR